MAIAISTVITRVNRIFKDCPSATIVDYINEMHSDICMQIPQILTTEDITLTDNTQEYTITTSDTRVFHAELWLSSTYRIPLNAFDVPSWDIQNPNWRSVVKNRPAFYAIWRNATQNILVLHPKPNQDTTDGYPFVRLYVSRISTLTSGDNLPENLLSPDVYVYGVAKRYAADRVPSKYQFYSARYEEAFSNEIQAKQINVKRPPVQVKNWVPRIGRI